jgi:monoamine oxidase
MKIMFHHNVLRRNLMKEVDVVIVGAGLAGLSAAWELTKRKINIAVIEAMDRVGGRVHSFQTKDAVTVDLGAQWIGRHQRRMRALAKEFRLPLVKTYIKGKTTYDLRGTIEKIEGEHPPLSPEGLSDLFQLKCKIERLVAELPEQDIWNSPLAKELDTYNLDAWIQTNMLTEEGRNFFNLFAEVMCVELSEPSALDLLWCLKTSGGFQRVLTAEEEWFSEGAYTLALKMADAMKDNIYVSTPVNRIQYSENGVLVFAEKEVWKAKKIIVAVPPTTSGHIEYHPPLPTGRGILTEKINQSSIVKMILIYDKPFWREEGLNGHAQSDRGLVRLVVDSSPMDGRKGVLTVLSGGRYAHKLARLEKQHRKQVVLKEIGFLFGPKAEQPIEFYDKDWTEEPWIRGGYAAHFPPGIITSLGEWLHQPIGPIHWASTETADEWKFYMEGAIQSGERAAKEVFNMLT